MLLLLRMEVPLPFSHFVLFVAWTPAPLHLPISMRLISSPPSGLYESLVVAPTLSQYSHLGSSPSESPALLCSLITFSIIWHQGCFYGTYHFLSSLLTFCISRASNSTWSVVGLQKCLLMNLTRVLLSTFYWPMPLFTSVLFPTIQSAIIDFKIVSFPLLYLHKTLPRQKQVRGADGTGFQLEDERGRGVLRQHRGRHRWY